MLALRMSPSNPSRDRTIKASGKYRIDGCSPSLVPSQLVDARLPPGLDRVRVQHTQPTINDQHDPSSPLESFVPVFLRRAQGKLVLERDNTWRAETAAGNRLTLNSPCDAPYSLKIERRNSSVFPGSSLTVCFSQR
jgi:hypothetical protein